jgi:hypothetical protein
MRENDKKDNDRPHDLRLKELTSVWGPAEAEVIKSFLESQGIPCIYKGRVVQSIHPFSVDGLGEIRIFVPEKDYETAKKLIETKPEEVPE